MAFFAPCASAALVEKYEKSIYAYLPIWRFAVLTLVLLNKLRCHAHFKFSANQITWSKLLILIHILNSKQCRSRSVGFFRSQLIWICTVCKCRTYPGSAGPGLKHLIGLSVASLLSYTFWRCDMNKQTLNSLVRTDGRLCMHSLGMALTLISTSFRKSFFAWYFKQKFICKRLSRFNAKHFCWNYVCKMFYSVRLIQWNIFTFSCSKMPANHNS